MHHPTDRITHTTAFVTPVVEHWLEREIAQWVHPMKDRSDDPSHHERTLLPRSYISLLRPPRHPYVFMYLFVFICIYLHTYIFKLKKKKKWQGSRNRGEGHVPPPPIFYDPPMPPPIPKDPTPTHPSPISKLVIRACIVNAKWISDRVSLYVRKLIKMRL